MELESSLTRLAAAGAIALAALLVMASVAKLADRPASGMTTDVAVLLMYDVGASRWDTWPWPSSRPAPPSFHCA